jgi:RIO-like serine/threonine protein kinase
MAEQHGSLNEADARILRALSCGGMLTEQQIKMAAGLTGWRTRQALANLTGRALVVTTQARRGRYQITQLGRNTLAAKAFDFGKSGV